MDVWMGWVIYESSYDYGDSRNLYTVGDAGRAYGAYQFDYRWGLVPFMQFCVQHDSATYSGFNEYIALGAGNPQLVNNPGLIALFRGYAQLNLDDFYFCQNQCFITDYLEPVKAKAQRLGVPHLDSPYFLGSIASFAIRDGYDSSTVANALNSAIGKDLDSALSAMYAVYNSAHPDGRWRDNAPGYAYGGQYGRVKADKASGSMVFDITNIRPKPIGKDETGFLMFVNFYGLESEIFDDD